MEVAAPAGPRSGRPAPRPSPGGRPTTPSAELGLPDSTANIEIDPADLKMFEIVGSGTTAEVFRGNYKSSEVAIKQIFKHHRMAVKEQVSFTREVQILSKIKHNNLVRLYGVTFADRPYRIITEFCQGGTLFELVHNARDVELVWSQKLKICSDVASGMHYLHSYKPIIMHRDLKSLNLLLDLTVSSSSCIPEVKVTDFGLGRMKEENDADWGKMTKQVGTLHWMAPEVFAGNLYDEKIDIYSYAMVVFEVICGEVPYDDEDPATIGSLVVKGGRPDLEAVPPDCPNVLQKLMTSCWAEKPMERPSFEMILRVLGSITPPASCKSTRPSRPTSAASKYSSKEVARGPFNSISL